jgi:hypothetical protein
MAYIYSKLKSAQGQIWYNGLNFLSGSNEKGRPC